MNVFSVMLKSASVEAPSRTFMSVGVLGGRKETLLTVQMAWPAIYSLAECEHSGDTALDLQLRGQESC